MYLTDAIASLLGVINVDMHDASWVAQIAQRSLKVHYLSSVAKTGAFAAWAGQRRVSQAALLLRP